MGAQFGDEKAFLAAPSRKRFFYSVFAGEHCDQLRALAVAGETDRGRRELRPKRNAGIFTTRIAPSSRSPSGSAPRICFLPAQHETPPEIVEAKEERSRARRSPRAQVKPCPQLAAEASEDEATKSRGGDLGFFSAARMPPEFFAEVKKLRVGPKAASPFRSHLGFHIAELTEIRASAPAQVSMRHAERYPSPSPMKVALLIAGTPCGHAQPSCYTTPRSRMVPVMDQPKAGQIWALRHRWFALIFSGCR